VLGNVVFANDGYQGGAVYAQHNCVVRSNRILRNTARREGGGVYAADNAAIRTNLIIGNYGDDAGGGVYGYEYGHYGPITGNTIVGNVSGGGGSGIRGDEGLISSNIVAFSPSITAAIGGGDFADYNCVFGNAGPPGNTGPHDVAADPEFVLGPTGTLTADPDYDPGSGTSTLTDALGMFTPGELVDKIVVPNTAQEVGLAILDNTQTTMTVLGDACQFDPNDGACQIAQAGDAYQIYEVALSSSSPCIGAGDPGREIDFYLGADMDGEPRVQDCNPDIGADEFTGTPTFVLNITCTMTTPTIEVSLADCNNRADSIGSFNRFYEGAPSVTLTAEQLEYIPFRWVIDGVDQPDGEYAVTVDLSDHVAALAEYQPVANITKGTYFTRIQDAISSYWTTDGDEIVVAPSTYVEIIDFLGKDIIVCSVAPTDPQIVGTTVIDGDHRDTVVTLSGGTISGFTIRAGDESSGGGVYASGTGVVSCNVIEDNRAWQWGAGVWAQDSVIVRDNLIRRNTDCQSGNGIAARGDVLIVGNTFTLNTSDYIGDEGGGAYLRERVLFIDNVVTENQSGRGGGVFAVDDSIVSYNIIADNIGLNRAGGVFARDDTLITNNFITDNESQDDENGGGGVYAYGTPLIANNAIIANRSLGPGGGVHMGWGADLVGNTIAQNSSIGQGSGVYASSLYEQFIVVQNVIAFNTGSYGLYANELIENDYNCVFGHDLGNYGGLANPGPHDIIADPLLSGDDIHLLPASPCIDAGDPAYPGEPNETDIDGQPRVADGDGDGNAIVDIGADEVPRPLEQMPGGTKIDPERVKPVPPP
jgi:hypothetical protein